MTPILAGFLDDFSDAFDFLLHERESVSGGIRSAAAR